MASGKPPRFEVRNRHRKRTPLVAVAVALMVIGVCALVAVNLRLR